MIYPMQLPDLSEDTLSIKPLAEASTIPASWYTSRAFFDWDIQEVFSHQWQMAGRLDQVQRPGDYFLANIAGRSVIVLKEKDGSLRGFYNICRHRGGPLATADGHASTLRCKYHGWTYGLDGRLIGTPEFDGVECFQAEDYGLFPVQVATWENLIFVNLSENPTPLNAVLGGILEKIAPLKLNGKTFHQRVVYDVECNWKVYVDNYLEGYHIYQVHPELANLLDYKNYTTEINPYYSLQYSPLKGQDNFYGGDQVFYYFIFPNMMLNIMPSRVQTNIVVPVGPDRSQVVFDYFYDDTTSPQARKMIEEDLAYSDVVQEQDIEICQHVQKNLESGVYHQGRFSVKREEGVYHFQNLLKEAYRLGMKRSEQHQAKVQFLERCRGIE